MVILHLVPNSNHVFQDKINWLIAIKTSKKHYKYL